ncbi:MAG: hypothetical protein ACOZF0_24090 [Thermodesulfobacteriota bacterium]
MEPKKMTWEKVDEIRKMYRDGVGGYKVVARKFGVSATMIRLIVLGKSWKEANRV